MPNRDDKREDTPVEVPFGHFEGATDPRLKGKIVDPRLSGTMGPETGSDSERPAPPAAVSERERVFERLAKQYADLSALSLQSRNRTNDHMALMADELKRLTRTARAPRGYSVLVAAVGLLVIAQVVDIWFLRHVMSLIAR